MNQNDEHMSSDEEDKHESLEHLLKSDSDCTVITTFCLFRY